jgi:hypothetical protein
MIGPLKEPLPTPSLRLIGPSHNSTIVLTFRDYTDSCAEASLNILRHTEICTLHCLTILGAFSIYGLYDDAVCSSECIVSDDRMISEWWIGKYWERRCLGLIKACLRLLGGTEENHQNISQNSRFRLRLERETFPVGSMSAIHSTTTFFFWLCYLLLVS